MKPQNPELILILLILINESGFFHTNDLGFVNENIRILYEK